MSVPMRIPPGLCARNLLALFISLWSLSCASVVAQKPTGRTPTDQLLTTLTVEDAVQAQQIRDVVKEKKIFVEIVTLSSDAAYIERAMQKHVMASGGTIVATAEEADLILVTMVNSAGTDTETNRLAIPIAVPLISQDGLTISRIEIYAADSQIGRCRIWTYAKNPMGQIVAMSDATYSEHFAKNRELLGATVSMDSDLPELDKGILGQNRMTETPPPAE